MPENVTPIDSARRKKQASSDDMYELLLRIDELEELLEAMDERGITTRAGLVNQIAELEVEAARRDSATDT